MKCTLQLKRSGSLHITFIIPHIITKRSTQIRRRMPVRWGISWNSVWSTINSNAANAPARTECGCCPGCRMCWGPDLAGIWRRRPSSAVQHVRWVEIPGADGRGGLNDHCVPQGSVMLQQRWWRRPPTHGRALQGALLAEWKIRGGCHLCECTRGMIDEHRHLAL